MFRKLFGLLLCVMPGLALAQVSDNGKPVKVVTNADVVGVTRWSSDTVYNMSGFVYVEDGERLIIEPGTIIKSNPGQAAAATALIVARGGRIYSLGTKTQPVIFTSISDDLDNPTDIPLPPSTLGRGLWGGIIVLGKATIADPAGENDIEGLPIGDPRNLYGGTDDNDNSGVIRYTSIRHGGSIIGAANEINGLSLGGVGRGTQIDYVEVFQNVDDAVELFGGTVNIKHMVCAFGGDDQIDYDEGWRGSAQFIFAINDSLDSDTYGEHDGAVAPEDATPFATPLLSNVTAIGAGNTLASINPQCFNIRDNAGGAYFNSIFVAHKGIGVRVEDLGSGADTRERLSVGDLHFERNMFFDCDGGYQNQTWVRDSIFGVPAWANDTTVDPQIMSINWSNIGTLDPRPSVASPAAGGWLDPVANYNPPANPALPRAGFFQTVSYRGAFDPNADLWTCGWTFLDFGNYTVDCAVSGPCATCATDDNKPVKVVTSADITGTVFFSPDTVYNLSGFVYVESGEVLIIGPGTVVKSNPGQAAAATALIVARGGQIYAQGTAECPIIFTSISDDVDVLNDIPLPPSTLGRGLWGGLMILGKATIADPAGENDIEGLPIGDPRNLYGGVDDNDNSGVLHYISVRHGGSIIGAANEINGISFGGTGRGTQVDHVEIFQNLDDAIELFGGTVNLRHIACAFGGDDQIDYDEGWRGAAQYIFAINDTLDSDTYGEHDGAVAPEDATPFATPLLSNVTAIGAKGAAAAINPQCFNIRDNAGGAYFNSIFSNHRGVAVRVEDLGAPADSRDRLSVGDMHFQNNMFWNCGSFQNQVWVRDSIFGVVAWMNDSTVNPVLGTINYGTKDSLDPRPDAAGPAVTRGWVDPVANFNPPANPGLPFAGFFNNAGYMGAFDPALSMDDQWTAGWTFLDCADYFGDNRVAPVGCCVGTTGNVDNAGVVDIGDLTFLIDHLFITFVPLPCPAEGNVDGAGVVDIGDLTYLIDHLFITFIALPNCP